MQNNAWVFPLMNWHLSRLPTKEEPGSFSYRRSKDIHTGVDLYTVNGATVMPCEDGRVVNIENYTGSNAGSPWWLPTKSILVEGDSGVICYGEVYPFGLKVGDYVKKYDVIAHVARVLINPPKIKIINHYLYMLHLELYTFGTTQSVWWYLNQEKPPNLLDPTENLQKALDKINNGKLV